MATLETSTPSDSALDAAHWLFAMTLPACWRLFRYPEGMERPVLRLAITGMFGNWLRIGFPMLLATLPIRMIASGFSFRIADRQPGAQKFTPLWNGCRVRCATGASMMAEESLPPGRLVSNTD